MRQINTLPRKPLYLRYWRKRFRCRCTMVQGHVCGFGGSWTRRSTCKWISWYIEERRYGHIGKFISTTGIMIHYHPQTKLREGNVFICVCLILFKGKFPCDHYPWCIGPHSTVHPPHIRPLTHPQEWHFMANRGVLFKLVYLRVVATEARTVCKRTVRILMAYFLIIKYFNWKAHF